ncbi:anti-sigma factor [Microbacterium sp. GXF7504]
MNERDFDELAAGHALHALSEEEERAFRRALMARPDHRARAEADEETAALLGDAVPEVVPPPQLKDALLARIASVAQDAAPQRDDEPDDGEATPALAEEIDGETWVDPPKWGPSRTARAWLALVAGLALLVAVGAGITVFLDQTRPTAGLVALERIESAEDAQSATATFGDGGTATAHWSAMLGEAVLVSDGLPVLPEDRDFELWFIRDGVPISAGVFVAEGDEATAELSGEMHEGDVIAVTIEPAGGSPSGDPSGPPILAVETS